MKPFSNRSANSIFTIVSALLLTALFLTLAYGNYRRERALIVKCALDNARTVARHMLVTRDYLSGTTASESHHNYNLFPQVASSHIAQELTMDSRFSVRHISLRYRNPKNKPDDFETAQLQSFRNRKAHENWQVITEQGKKSLRYILVMAADQSCLTCHGTYDTAPAFVRARFPREHTSYGYQVGEVIGAISVTVPMERLYSQIGTNLKHNLFYDACVLVAFLAVIASIMRRAILTPVKNVADHISDVARTGNFSHRLENSGSNEVGQLIGSFNELMGELDRKTRQRMESEERYRNFIEIAQSPIITFLSDGKIVISNQKAEKLFGLTKQELLGLSILDFMEDGEHLRSAIEAYFNDGSSDLIGTTTLQKVRDVCGRIFDTEMVISVSQSDQTQMFTAILRPARDNAISRSPGEEKR